MNAALNTAERGRQPGDPSPELIALIRVLQHTHPTEELFAVPFKLYFEAHNWTVYTGNSIRAKDNHPRVNMFFCGHFITPDAA